MKDVFVGLTCSAVFNKFGSLGRMSLRSYDRGCERRAGTAVISKSSAQALKTHEALINGCLNTVTLFGVIPSFDSCGSSNQLSLGWIILSDKGRMSKGLLLPTGLEVNSSRVSYEGAVMRREKEVPW